MSLKKFGVILLLVVTVGGYFYWKKNGQTASPKTPAIEMYGVKRGDLKKIFRETGEVIPKSAIEIHAKVSGRILELNVGEGQTIKAGDRLALLQPGKSELDRYVPVEIVAPISGIILAGAKDEAPKEGERFIQVGDYVAGLFDSTKATPLMTIADMREMAVELKISEMEILKLKPGITVTVKIDALLNESFSGVIESIAPRAMKNSNDLKVFRVVVGLSRADGRLRAGMTARVEAVLASRSDVIKIPLSAVYEETSGQFVYAQMGGESKKVSVVTGLKNELEVEIVSGLAEGDQVYLEKPPEDDSANKKNRKNHSKNGR